MYSRFKKSKIAGGKIKKAVGKIEKIQEDVQSKQKTSFFPRV